MDTSGHNVHKLAQGALPDWSPDGRRIAFTSFNDPDSTAEISVMAANGRSQVRLTDTKEREGNPAWSPDGRKIAFLRADSLKAGSHEIYVMNADGTGVVTRLTHTAIGEVTSVAWQPISSS